METMIEEKKENEIVMPEEGQELLWVGESPQNNKGIFRKKKKTDTNQSRVVVVAAATKKEVTEKAEKARGMLEEALKRENSEPLAKEAFREAAAARVIAEGKASEELALAIENASTQGQAAVAEKDVGDNASKAQELLEFILPQEKQRTSSSTQASDEQPVSKEDDVLSMTSLNAILDAPPSNQNTPTSAATDATEFIEKVTIAPKEKPKKGILSRLRKKKDKGMETQILESVSPMSAPPPPEESPKEDIQRFIASVRVRDRTDLTALTLNQTQSLLNMQAADSKIGLTLQHAIQQDETQELATFDGVKVYSHDEEDEDDRPTSPIRFQPPKEPRFITAPAGRAQSLTQKSWDNLVQKGAIIIKKPDKEWYREDMDEEIPPPAEAMPSPLSSNASPTKLTDKYMSVDGEDNGDDDDAYSFVESACGSFDAAFEAMGLDPGEVGPLDENGEPINPKAAKPLNAGPVIRSFEDDASTQSKPKRRLRIVGVINRLRGKDRSSSTVKPTKKRSGLGGLMKSRKELNEATLTAASTEGTSPTSEKSTKGESEFSHIINQSNRGRKSVDPATGTSPVARGLDP